MLSIDLHNEEDVASFTLSGDLSGNGVDELRSYYRALSVLPFEKSIVLDVTGVTSIDAAGTDLLAEMVRKGADVITGIPATPHSLAEIIALIQKSRAPTE